MNKMSEFYAKVISDPELRAKVNAVLGDKDISKASDEELKAIGEIAKAAGFEISLDDAKQYFAAEAKELSDDALDAVAGGINKGEVDCTGKGAGTWSETSGDVNVNKLGDK